MSSIEIDMSIPSASAIVEDVQEVQEVEEVQELNLELIQSYLPNLEVDDLLEILDTVNTLLKKRLKSTKTKGKSKIEKPKKPASVALIRNQAWIPYVQQYVSANGWEAFSIRQETKDKQTGETIIEVTDRSGSIPNVATEDKPIHEYKDAKTGQMITPAYIYEDTRKHLIYKEAMSLSAILKWTDGVKPAKKEDEESHWSDMYRQFLTEYEQSQEQDSDSESSSSAPASASSSASSTPTSVRRLTAKEREEEKEQKRLIDEEEKESKKRAKEEEKRAKDEKKAQDKAEKEAKKEQDRAEKEAKKEHDKAEKEAKKAQKEEDKARKEQEKAKEAKKSPVPIPKKVILTKSPSPSASATAATASSSTASTPSASPSASKVTSSKVTASSSSKAPTPTPTPTPSKIISIPKTVIKKSVPTIATLPKEEKMVWNIPDDELVHTWTFQGQRYAVNAQFCAWKEGSDGEVGEWVGMVNLEENRIDDSIPEPEYD